MNLYVILGIAAAAAVIYASMPDDITAGPASASGGNGDGSTPLLPLEPVHRDIAQTTPSTIASTGGAAGTTVVLSPGGMPILLTPEHQLSSAIPTPPTGDWWTTTAQAAAGNAGHAAVLDSMKTQYTVLMWNWHREQGGKPGIDLRLVPDPQAMMTAGQYLKLLERHGIAGLGRLHDWD